MRTHHCIVLLSAVASLAFISGCPKKTGTFVDGVDQLKYDRQLPPGALALRKITDPRDIPDFTKAAQNTLAMREAIDNSLNYLAKPSSEQFFPYGQITHAQAVASLKAFRELLDTTSRPDQFNQAIRERFDVYISVGCDDRGTVLFTGYYTPIFDASPTRTERFRYPLYKAPADLAKSPDGTTLGRRDSTGNVVGKYPDRKTIESSNMLAGQELYWLSDPFEVYVAHVQGSAKLRLPDGRMVNVGYAGNNGYDYKSVGKEMLADEKFQQGKLSLRAMIEYFKAHPQDVQKYTWKNPRFVFFQEAAHEPHGCLNEPVTRLRSIATDKTVFPRACLAFVTTKVPARIMGEIQLYPYDGFAMDQDAGGAIRAPGRCDIYMGVGDEAGELAGRTQEEGRLYYLFLKPGGPAPAALPVMGPSGK